MSKVQRKQGVGGLFRPVSWNKGRRFTSPGPEIQKLNENTGIQNYEGPLMRLQIEAYLDDNPEFAESYVLRKISRKTIEKWLKLHSVQEQENPLLIVQEPTTPGRKFSDEPSYSSQIRKRFSADNSPTIHRSISVTPNRKISASVFEASGLRSAILSTADDGSASFLSTNSAVDLSRQRSKSLILVGEQRSIKDVTNTIISELDLSVLCQKIAHHLLSISQGSECTIALPTDGLKRGYRIEAINIRQNGVGGVRQISALPLPDSRVEIDNSTVSLLTDGKLVYLPSSSNLFPKTSQVTLPGATVGICLIPLRDIQEELQGFAAVKGRDLLELQANTVLLDLARISGICLKNSTQYNAARLEVTRSQVFLDLARVIFDEQTSIEFTVLKILINFLSLIECERAQVLLSSAESPTQFHKVFDLEEADLNRPDFEELKSPFENRFPINSSISGLVAATGETVNIGDLSTDHRFDPRLNGDVDVEHRSLLCMPILDSDQKILGVISLINKKEGQFTWNDERFVEAFGIFCGIALRNVSQFEIVQSAEARCQVALEIMSYHADSDPKEAEELSKLPVPSVLSLQLQSLTFLDTELQERDTVRACLRMFYELDLVSRFGLDHNVLCRWLLTTKKNYRVEVLYHNWNHAFNVAQMMFSCLLNSGWWSGLGPISCLGLLIACLSHDLDHRGTNNSYQLSTDSPLARLYSTSTLERHHLNQTLVILNLQDNRILEPLNSSEYTAVLTIVEEAIIATDLALHFAHLSKLTALSR
ncbi:dual 3',5'-cyclic-AMP and -GMP phosphodiesterase 11 [Eurytemora carolleeae]|uniref:dual 3',5'-cyclic-AMP and -GMP phosphodiesterase 11 n=1 Tax=Eurytemora carolleeae TaxID=1294199 RepID=UPI000C78D34C|nr:dual 3',5'-cyclic-AMP and -GMP phosphodiesterase 11 [Eurytemora carolleeae]|eukprot:XP_023323155.1 dual 3',5'-cyclic-AMP and -GMP phosphodiesterase 11-like [Eurytemora affinis]